MAIEKIEIIVIGKDKGGKKVVDDQNKSLEKLKKTGKEIGKELVKVAAAAAIMGIALKKALDFGRRGAVVRQTTAAFNALMGGVLAGEAALMKYQDAAKGTISRIELMGSVTTALAGTQGELRESLQQNSTFLLKVAKAASALNPQLGTTAFMYESINRGIKRSSPLILDNLGLTIKLGEAYQTFADKAGIAVEEMSAVEKQLALLEGTMEAGNILIEQAGDLVDSDVDSFDRLSAGVKDFGDAIAATDNVLTKFAESQAEGASADAALIREYGLGTVALASFTGTRDELIRNYNKRISEQIRLTEGLAAVQAIEAQGLLKMGQGYSELNPNIIETNRLLEEETRLTQDATAAAEVWIDTFARSIEVSEAIDATKEKIAELVSEEERLTREIETFGRAAGQTSIETSRAALALQIELKGVQAEIGNVTAAWDEQTKQMLFNMTQQRLALDGFTTEELTALTKLAGPEGFGLIDQAAVDFIGKVDASASQMEAAGDQSDLLVGDLQDLQTEFLNAGTGVGELGDAIETLPKEITIDVNFNVGNLPNIPGATGGGGGSGAPPQLPPGLHLGGHGVVPPGYPNDSYRIGLSSGEEFSVSRPGADKPSGGRGGGGGNITFIYNPQISTGNAEEMRRAIQPFVEAGYRKLQEERKL